MLSIYVYTDIYQGLKISIYFYIYYALKCRGIFLFFVFFGVAILPHAQYDPYYVTVFFFFWHGDGGQLGWFVFIRIRNTKPWNHFHMCIVVLWTKIVVEFMLLWSG